MKGEDKDKSRTHGHMTLQGAGGKEGVTRGLFSSRLHYEPRIREGNMNNEDSRCQHKSLLLQKEQSNPQEETCFQYYV